MNSAHVILCLLCAGKRIFPITSVYDYVYMQCKHNHYLTSLFLVI